MWQLVELYLTQQKRTLNEYMDGRYKGDDWFINKASRVLDRARRRSFLSTDITISELKGAIALTDAVLGKNKKNKLADKVKSGCLEMIKELQG